MILEFTKEEASHNDQQNKIENISIDDDKDNEDSNSDKKNVDLEIHETDLEDSLDSDIEEHDENDDDHDDETLDKNRENVIFHDEFDSDDEYDNLTLKEENQNNLPNFNDSSENILSLKNIIRLDCNLKENKNFLYYQIKDVPVLL